MKKHDALLSLLALLLCLSTVYQAHSQAATDTPVNHELGLRLYGLSDFNLIYKKQSAPGKFKRYRFGLADFNYTAIDENKNFNLNLGLAVGNERRREIAEKLYFLHGTEIIGGFGLSDQRSNNFDTQQFRFSLELGIVLGFQYSFSERFYTSLEVIPSVGVTYTSVSDPSPDQFQLGGGFNSNAVALSLVYCFSTKKKY